MAINFPASPTLNQTFSSGNVNYVWDGTKWTASVTGGISLDKIEKGNTKAEVVDTGSDGRFVVTTEGSERLRVDSSGRVGIGNTTAGSYNVGFNQLVVGSGGDQGVTIVSGTSSSGTLAFADGTSGADAYRGYVQYQHGSTNALVFATDGSERFRCDSSGRLLVGTSSARTDLTSQLGTATNGLLQVEAISNSAANNGLQIIGNSAAGWGGLINLAHNGGSQGTNTLSGDNTIGGAINFLGNDGNGFHTAATIECRFDGAPANNSMPGKLSFYTTASGASSPTERMRITNEGWNQLYSTGNATLSIANSRANSTNDYFIIGTSGATGVNTGASRFIVYTNGNVLNTNGSYGAISDLKLKENVVDANSQWGDIKALQVRNYNLKEGETHKQIGLIAQEVELVSPGLVSESPDRDAEGNDLGTTTKSVNYSVLYMKAVKTLQEAMERIETLEAKVAALESA